MPASLSELRKWPLRRAEPERRQRADSDSRGRQPPGCCSAVGASELRVEVSEVFAGKDHCNERINPTPHLASLLARLAPIFSKPQHYDAGCGAPSDSRRAARQA